MKNIVKIEFQINHKRRAAGVGLSKSKSNTNIFDIQSGTYRKSGDKASRVSCHIGTRLVIISQSNIKPVVWNKISSEDKMPEKI